MKLTKALFPVLVALLVVPAWAKKEEKPSEMYAEREGKFLRAVAARYVDLGDEARKRNLYDYAREEYTEALKYDENNADARDWMGYVRQGTEWVLDPEKAERLPKSAQFGQGKGKGKKGAKTDPKVIKKLRDEHLELRAKQLRWVAARYANLGDWCEKEGLRDQAVKAWDKALTLDKNCKKARKGLGYERVGKEWLTEKQIQARKDATEGKLVDDSPSNFEGPLGITLNKIESAHFRIESVFGEDELKEYVKQAETCYAYFLRDAGENEVMDIWGRKAKFLVLDTQEQWIAYVDKFGTHDKRQSDFMKQMRGSGNSGQIFYAEHMGEKGNQRGLVDGIVHQVAHFMVFHHWLLQQQAWLQEGFAYYYTKKVLETTSTHCVALGDYYSQTGGLKEWGKSDNWRELVKEEVVKGNDPDIRMFYKQQTKDLQYQATVKAWSLISWLFDKHREKFLEFIRLVGQEKMDQEEAFKETFGWSFEDVDKNWREFVKENY